MDLAGAGYQFMNGTHLGVIVMFVFGIILGAAGILAAKGTENNT